MSAEFTPGPWTMGPTPGYLAMGQQNHGMGSPITIRSEAHTEEIATVWTYLLPTEANARLITAAPDLLEALRWALPLAEMAIESHRIERIRLGHSDIIGTYKNGATWVGISQDEVDQIEKARAVISFVQKGPQP